MSDRQEIPTVEYVWRGKYYKCPLRAKCRLSFYGVCGQRRACRKHPGHIRGYILKVEIMGEIDRGSAPFDREEEALANFIRGQLKNGVKMCDECVREFAGIG